MKEYDGLGDLLTSNNEAFSYYKTLPDYVRSMIARRSQSVCSVEQLHHYAENLLRGDG